MKTGNEVINEVEECAKKIGPHLSNEEINKIVNGEEGEFLADKLQRCLFHVKYCYTCASELARIYYNTSNRMSYAPFGKLIEDMGMFNPLNP